MRLRCEVLNVTYSNADSGWGVLKAKAEGYNVPVTLVGLLADITPGTSLEIEGEWRNDPRFGRQVQVKAWQEIMPSTLDGLKRYIGSGVLYGVGPHFAQLIVDKFGMDTIRVLDTDIKRLLEIPNLGKRKLERIRESWEKQKGVRSVSMFLQEHGVSSAYASKIYARYGADTVATVKADPYRLADDIWGIGFRYADGIAQSLGYATDDPRRIRSGILYQLTRLAESDGHVYARRPQLVQMASALLQTDGPKIEEALAVMTKGNEIVCEDEAVYLPMYFYAERGCARRLKEMAAREVADLNDGKERLTADDIEYDESQASAVHRALSSAVMVLTGGPGTGKTTTTRAIIDAFAEAGKTILLAAPTGRAAKRMTEATGMDAKTIHRLLEYTPIGGCGRDEDNPLEGDVLIVDECSMIDLLLFHKLLKAVPEGMSLVMVGDTDQLPSVGAGNVLQDVIDSGCVPVCRLTRIFRQAQTSRIVMNAHAVNHGQAPDLSNARGTDFFFISSTPSRIPEMTVSLVRDRLSKAYSVQPKEIQVLTPMHKGDAGAVNLNVLLQEALNPGKAGLERGETEYRKGDKVMQIRNNYDKGVFNGDIGYVESIDCGEKTLTVNFDGTDVEYESSELDELTLAYAITIHKSQGCEFPIVVVPVTMKHSMMLKRNLLYTAVTRAKQICVIVGEEAAVRLCVNNSTATKRNRRLAQRLAE